MALLLSWCNLWSSLWQMTTIKPPSFTPNCINAKFCKPSQSFYQIVVTICHHTRFNFHTWSLIVNLVTHTLRACYLYKSYSLHPFHLCQPKLVLVNVSCCVSHTLSLIAKSPTVRQAPLSKNLSKTSRHSHNIHWMHLVIGAFWHN